MNKKKNASLKYKLSGIFSAMLILLLMAATIVRPKGSISYQENRNLADFPKLTFSSIFNGSFINSLSDYSKDQFAFRSKFLNLNADMSFYNGERVVNDVYITNNMLLNAKKREKISEWSSASKINDFSSNCDSAVYVIAVPSSDGVYADKLPKHLTSYTQKSMIDDFYSKLDNNIKRIDAYNVLKMLNENYIYYRNDSKWTSYGAYCVYRTAIQKLGFIPIAYDKYTIEHITSDFKGDLYNKSQYSTVEPDILDIYYDVDGSNVTKVSAYDKSGISHDVSLYNRQFAKTNYPYRIYPSESNEIIKINTNVKNDKKLLIIKDSYANCFIPFLIQHYSQIAVVPENFDSRAYSDIIDLSQYGQVLFLINADRLSQTNCLSVINKEG